MPTKKPKTRKTKSKSKKYSVSVSIKKPMTRTKIAKSVSTKKEADMLRKEAKRISEAERTIKKYEAARKKAKNIKDDKKRKAKLSAITQVINAARNAVRKAETRMMGKGAIKVSEYMGRDGSVERKVRERPINIKMNQYYSGVVVVNYIPKVDVVGTDGQTIEAGAELYRQAYLDEQTLGEWFYNQGLDEEDYILIGTSIKEDLI